MSLKSEAAAAAGAQHSVKPEVPYEPAAAASCSGAAAAAAAAVKQEDQQWSLQTSLSPAELETQFLESVLNERQAATGYLLSQGLLLLQLLERRRGVIDPRDYVRGMYSRAHPHMADSEVTRRCSFVCRLWEARAQPLFVELFPLLSHTCISTLHLLLERCWTTADNLPLVHKLLTACHSKNADGTMHVLSKGDVEAGLKGWKKQDLEDVKSPEEQEEVAARFRTKVKLEQQNRRNNAEEKKQTKTSKRAKSSPTLDSKRQRTKDGFEASSAASSSAAAASSAAAPSSAFDLLPFDSSALPADGDHFRLSAVPNEWRPDRLPDRSDGLSPFMGGAYRYLRNIPFGPINYKLALVSPKTEDQQYNAEWISWTQQQALAPPKLKQPDEQDFWKLAAQGDATHLHFKDMEQWYHTERGSSNEAIKYKPDKKNPNTHIQRVHNPWRWAQIEKQAEHSVRDLDAVRVQLEALHVPALCAQSSRRTSLVSADMADLLGRAWTHRDCDRNNKKRCEAGKPEEHQHWIPDCTVYHPVNFSYLSSHPKNLLSILPHYCRYTWIRAKDGKTHVEQHSMYEFSGLTSGSWYVKCGDDFFYLHIEQLSTWFANFCHEGAMRWYFIAWTQLDGIVRAMLKALARQAPSKVTTDALKSINALAADSKAEPELRNLIRMLILGKRCLPSIDDLRAEGVQVDIVDQYAGQMVMGDGIVFHQGRSLTPSNVHEAINFMPITWLLRGLPELLATLKDFEMFPAAFKAVQQSKFAWITDQLGLEGFLFAHVLVPMEWSFCLLSFLQQDLQQHLQVADGLNDSSQRSRFDYSSLSQQECQLASKQIEECLDMLCNSDNLYEFFRLAFPTDANIKGNFRLKLASVSAVEQ